MSAVKRRQARRAKGWTASRVVTGEYGAVRRKPRVVREHHPAVVTSPKAVRQSRDRGYETSARPTRSIWSATGSYEGSLSMEDIPDRRKHRPLRGGVESGLGGSLTQGTRRRTQKGAVGYSKEAAHAKACETEGKSGRRQGCQRLGLFEHRGKKTPTPAKEVGDDLGAGRSTEWKACSRRSAEAVRTS
jgi:hypothetical protein